MLRERQKEQVGTFQHEFRNWLQLKLTIDKYCRATISFRHFEQRMSVRKIYNIFTNLI